MMFSRIFDPAVWAAVPPQFWAIVFFVFGCMVGSFLNVCIHRLPLGQSIVSPPLALSALPVFDSLVPQHSTGDMAVFAR